MTDDLQPAKPEDRWHKYKDPLIAGALAAALLTAVVVAWLVSRNAPSSTFISDDLPIAQVTLDQGCNNFGVYWQDTSGIRVPTEAISSITNCRQDADGEWIVPEGPSDGRLATSPKINPADEENARQLQAEITTEVAGLSKLLPTSLQKALGNIYSQDPVPVAGHVKEGLRITTTRSRYQAIAETFLLDPQNDALADYVGWLMATRSTGWSEFYSACKSNPDLEYLLAGCRGIEDALSVRYIPFTWDLLDPLLMEEYLAQRFPVA